MNKVLSLLFTMFVSLLVPQTISAQVKFDFNASNHAVSANGVSDGDIIEAETYYMDGVTLTISPATKGTPNRYWGTGNGPQLRMYSGTITIDAGSKAITKITVGSGKWNASNTFNDVASADGNWEGSAANVILAIAGNTQMNYIEVTVSDDSSSETKAATRIVFADGYETKATCGKDESVKLPIATVMADSAAVEGAAVTWSLSGDSLAQLDGDVLKIFNGVQGTVDVKAEYAGDDSHFSCSKTYTLTIYKGYMLLSSIIDDVTSSNPKWDNGGEYASYWFVNEDFKPIPNIVTYANGRYIYLTNGTENLLFYGINTQDLKQGDVISGALDNGQLGAVWGKLYRYNNLPEFAFTDMDVQIQDSVTVVPKTITVDQLGDNINAYVEIENAKFVSVDKKNLTFNAGETEFLVYNQFNVPIEALEEGATYTLTGLGSVYKTTMQLYLTSFVKTGDVVIIDPQPQDENLVEIPQDQGEGLDGFARAELVLGDSCNIYTANSDLTIAFKMTDIDVKDCDYVVIKFAEPVAAGWHLALWSTQDLVDVPEGATEYKYVFAEDPKCDVSEDGILPQLCMMTFFGGFQAPLVAKVEGIYKHQVPGQTVEIPDSVGTLERPFTVAEAVALASSLEVGQQTEQAYYVKGYISSINYEFDEKYGNATFQISDMDSTGTSFNIYRTQYLENTLWKEGYTQVAVGDEVIIYGLFTNYKGTPETVSKQTYIYSLNGRTKCETIVEPIEGISYSWESPEGEPIQWGGTIAYVNGDGNRLNYFSSGYYSICLNGKKANVNDETASANAGKMVITLDKPLNAGDTIAYTAYINKDISKKASPYILFENGSAIEGELFFDEANISEVFLGVPTLKYTIVPEEAAGSKTITLTRSQTGTNLFITKLQVIENTHPIDNPTYAMGDVNTDGFVDVTDVVCIIDNILEKYSDNFDASLADVNGDNEINVTDVVMVIESILGRIELSRGSEMIDRSAYTAFQMDLTIPAGYVLESVSLTDIAKDSHTLAYNMLADGRCRVVVCSMNNEALPGAWDEVISLNLRGKGDAQVNIDRAVFVTIDGERHELMLNPTSIAEISNLKSQISNLYDLQGRKFANGQQPTAKGLYIIDGKKTLRK